MTDSERPRLWQVDVVWAATAYAWATTEAKARAIVDDMLYDADEVYRTATAVNNRPDRNEQVYYDYDEDGDDERGAIELWDLKEGVPGGARSSGMKE